MEWVKKLHGKVVGLDSSPLIYFVEAHPQYLPLIRPFFEAVEYGRIQVVTSAITLTEVLVHPLRHHTLSIALQYSDILLSSPNFTTHSATAEIATKAAELRAAKNLKTPDAIHLATAHLANAAAFLTNDRGLAVNSNIPVLLLDDLLASHHP